MTEEKIETIPATEESLMIENDVHPFDEDLPKTVNFFEQMHPVLVDGIKGKACTGTLGTYSDRIRINLEEEHPELGTDFQTKYFIFKEPGLVLWGHNESTFKIEKIV
ncbi:MAG: hypothetical protein DWC06_02560 [Candidatus Poseidoniales archaeon]|nr:MAG: hypothetical protein DWC06_02560 [Candidatus Poseidoniales archaeon]